ncbi:unnamed protein product [Prorocentrum cordatum]|uniref:Inorganic phosphate transporter n=1 Tax=Prorocentrum cordatum TaxID=2364126 RepID=A0ABN9RM55_9DINO|nr:unnamed protein product [Polarella glacialis]
MAAEGRVAAAGGRRSGRLGAGVHAGGRYPLAAAIAAEDSPVGGSRGRLVAAVFSMQGWGMLLSCLLSLLLLAAGLPLEHIWRLLLVVGAIPPAAVIYARSKMEESELFLAAKEGATSAGAGSAWQAIRKYWHPLIGTTSTWFILDVTFYGTGSFKTRIGSFLMGSRASSPREEIWDEAVFASVCCCLAIPGYLLAVAFMDRIGRYNLQFWGFLALAANFFTARWRIAGVYRDDLPEGARWGLLVCFGLTFLFSNFGPNTTTFVIPIVGNRHLPTTTGPNKAHPGPWTGVRRLSWASPERPVASVQGLGCTFSGLMVV